MTTDNITETPHEEAERLAPATLYATFQEWWNTEDYGDRTQAERAWNAALASGLSIEGAAEICAKKVEPNYEEILDAHEAEQDRSASAAQGLVDDSDNATLASELQDIVKSWLGHWSWQVRDRLARIAAALREAERRIRAGASTGVQEETGAGVKRGRVMFAAELLGHLNRCQGTTACYHLVKSLCRIEIGETPDDCQALTENHND